MMSGLPTHLPSGEQELFRSERRHRRKSVHSVARVCSEAEADRVARVRDEACCGAPLKEEEVAAERGEEKGIRNRRFYDHSRALPHLFAVNVEGVYVRPAMLVPAVG